MTKVIMNIADGNGTFYFDCLNHAGDHDVCTIASTLCNVVVARCLERGYDITEYESGHVRIVSNRSDSGTNDVMRAVLKVFEELAEQNPDFVKIY